MTYRESHLFCFDNRDRTEHRSNSKQLLIFFLAISTMIPNIGSSKSLHFSSFNCDVKIDHLDCDEDGTPNGEDIAPLDPCIGGKNQLASNDCDGDGLTVGQGDTDDKDFCVPNPTSACENNGAHEEEIEEEIELGSDPIVVETAGITAIITNPCPTEVEDYGDCDGDGTPNNEDTDPFDPCSGGTKILATNDCDGDGITVGQGDTDDFDFCVPVAQPSCDSSSAIEEEEVEGITDNSNIVAVVKYAKVALKALLQGAYDEDNPAIMHDKLRAAQLIPLNEPYRDLKIYDGDPIPFKIVGRGGETVKKEILDITGEDAIVDWVLVQFHDENDPREVLATRSALIQRDGDIVDTDGVSPLKVSIKPGKYYISIRHRNHLGVMTKTAMVLSKNINSTIDFTNLNTPTFELEDTRKKSNHPLRRIDDLNYLWGGNSNGDWATIYQGPGLDQTKVFYDIFVDDKNKGPDGFPNYNYIKRGYNISDSNMDGEIRYQGPDNDVDDLQFFNIILHPDNPGFFSNKIIYEQIPTNKE